MPIKGGRVRAIGLLSLRLEFLKPFLVKPVVGLKLNAAAHQLDRPGPIPLREMDFGERVDVSRAFWLQAHGCFCMR